MWGLWDDGRGSKLLLWGVLRNERDGNSLPRNLQPRMLDGIWGMGNTDAKEAIFLLAAE
jgi:hypothetical protein